MINGGADNDETMMVLRRSDSDYRSLSDSPLKCGTALTGLGLCYATRSSPASFDLGLLPPSPRPSFLSCAQVQLVSMPAWARSVSSGCQMREPVDPAAPPGG